MIAKFEPSRPQSMELKYCERCGNIWLRRSGSPRSLCAPCASAEAATCRNGSGSFLNLWTRLRAEVEA
jgi:Zn-finger nucleic acid-binding protein